MSDYRFESQTVADKLGQIIDASIGYVNKKQQRDKSFRGTVGNVSGTTADVYLFNSTTPLPNVKIGSGIRHLFTDEDVYITAIGGRLENSIIDKRVIDYDLLFGESIDNFLTIDDFSVETHDWTCTAPSTASVIAANDYYRLYTGAKKVKYLTATNIYYFQCIPTNPLDLTKFHDLDASTDEDIIYFSYYIGYGLEHMLGMQILLYSGTDIFSYTISYETLITGWNRIKQTKSSFYKTGTPSWSSIDKIVLAFGYDQPVELDYFINFGYLGMAKLFISVEEYSLRGKINTLEEAMGNISDRVTNVEDTNSQLVQDVNAVESDVTDLQTNKQDKNDLLTDISALTGFGLLAKSSDIYIPTLNSVANQTSITFTPTIGSNISIGFATDYLKLYTKIAKYGVLYESYTWNTDLAVIELGAGASLSIPTVSSETNEFFIFNNFYKREDGYINTVFPGSGSAIILKRDEINFVTTEYIGSYFDRPLLRIAENYIASTPIPIVHITDENLVIQSNITLRTAVLNWYYDICKVIQVGDTGAVFAYVETDKNINISQNLLYDNSSHDYRRIEATQSTLYQQKKGEHVFYIAGSDTAGSAITFTQAFKIDNNGDFYLGSRKLTISVTEPSTPTTGDLWLDVS